MSTDPGSPGAPSPRASAGAGGSGGSSPRADTGQLPLGDYIRALVSLLDAAEPPSAQRLRRVVGPHVAHIRLDQQAVLVSFAGTDLIVRECAPREPGPNEAGPRKAGPQKAGPQKAGPEEAADGSGGTDSATVRDLLAGRLEITDAITSGRIEVSGNSAGLTAILFAIEILLDAAARVPGLRTLGAAFQEPPPARSAGPGAPRQGTDDPELRLLARLDLLPPAEPGTSPDSRPGPDR